MPYSQFIDRVHRLGVRVEQAPVFHGNEFRSALCNLISEIPIPLESEARKLCQEVVCPPAIELVEHLQKDIDTNSHLPEYAIVFYPLMRVAIAIRAGELSKAA